MKYFLSIFVLVLSSSLHAQITTKLPIDTAKQNKGGTSLTIGTGMPTDTSQHKKSGTSLSVGSGGVKITKEGAKKKTVELQFGMLDLGINSLIDNTNYQSQETRDFLHVSDPYANADLFSLRSNKSVNVNIYPLMVKAHLYNSSKQKITLASGLGLQLYNFRFTKPVNYEANPTPYVTLDTISFSKNKLAFDYLMLPLMMNFKTKLADNKSDGIWLTYGIGVSGGYLIQSWTKQISDERGKQKEHDQFNFRNTNFCVNGEIGIDGYIRLFATYQVTSLHEYGLDQHPLSIGVRFLGL
jgi:hypothetical protein